MTYQHVVIFIAFLLPAPAFAGAAAGGSTEWTQILNNIELIEQVKTQIKTYRDIRRTLEIEINNARKFQTYVPNVLGDYLKLYRTVKKGAALGYNVLYNIEKFEESHPGYDSFVNNVAPQQVYDRAQQQFTENRAATTNALESVVGNADILSSEAALIGTLQKASQNAGGRMEAMQVANEIALAEMRQQQRTQVLLQQQLALQAHFLQNESTTKEIQAAQHKDLWRSVIPKDPNRKVFGTSDDLKVW